MPRIVFTATSGNGRQYVLVALYYQAMLYVQRHRRVRLSAVCVFFRGPHILTLARVTHTMNQTLDTIRWRENLSRNIACCEILIGIKHSYNSYNSYSITHNAIFRVGRKSRLLQDGLLVRITNDICVEKTSNKTAAAWPTHVWRI